MADIRYRITVSLALLCSIVTASQINIPKTDLQYQVQRASTLPMTLQCPSHAYKHIEVRGVTLDDGNGVVPADSLYPGINAATNEECLATMTTNNKKPECTVSMKDIPFDERTTEMVKVVVFDCRKTLAGSSVEEVKTISKKKGTINVQCPDKDDNPEIISITLASGKYVDVQELQWKCTKEDIDEKRQGRGGHCQIRRPNYLNDSEMTVKYKCSSPPRRDFKEFFTGN